jgi:hypothetical protein
MLLFIIIKILLTPFAIIASLCNLFVGLILWDERPMLNSATLCIILWTDKEKDTN